MGIANDSLDELSVLGSREGLAFSERQRTFASEVRGSPFGRVAAMRVPVWRRDQEVGQVVARDRSCVEAEGNPTFGEATLEERPAEREEDRLAIGRRPRCRPMGRIDEPKARLEREPLELFGQKGAPHFDGFNANDAPEQLLE